MIDIFCIPIQKRNRCSIINLFHNHIQCCRVGPMCPTAIVELCICSCNSRTLQYVNTIIEGRHSGRPLQVCTIIFGLCEDKLNICKFNFYCYESSFIFFTSETEMTFFAVLKMKPFIYAAETVSALKGRW